MDGDIVDISEIKVINELFQERERKIEEVKKLRQQLDDLIKEERELYLEVRSVSLEICNMQGHRLSSKRLNNMTLSRKCLVCGQIITPYNSNNKDSVLEATPDFPANIVYRKHKNTR